MTDQPGPLPLRFVLDERQPISTEYVTVRSQCLQEPDDELLTAVVALLTDAFGPDADLPSEAELRLFGRLACEELYFWLRDGWEDECPRRMLRAAAARAYKPLALPPRPEVAWRLWHRHHPATAHTVAATAAAFELAASAPLDAVRLRRLRRVPLGVLEAMLERVDEVGCLDDVDRVMERAIRSCYKTLDPGVWWWVHILEVEAA